MTRRPRLLPLPIAAMLCSAALAGPTAEQSEIGERLLQFGQKLTGRADTARVAAALADVAETLYSPDATTNNGADAARLLRTDADLRLALGQRDRALDLLNAYRKKVPADQLAQVQAIDLQQDKMQSATARADYLTAIAGSDRVSSEVRAHAAVLLAAVQLERGDDAAAAAAVDQALGLNPLNPKALQMRLDRVTASGTPARRVEALIGLLAADPLQFQAVSRITEEMLRAGLGSDALDLYPKFFAAVAASGYAVSADDATNYAVQLSLASREKEAADVASRSLADFPADVGLNELKLLLARSAGDDAGFKAALVKARTSLVGNVEAIHKRLLPNESFADGALPDVKAGAAAAQSSPDRGLADAYLAALGDLAWLDVYFAVRAPDPAVTAAIDTLAGEAGPLARRIKGYAALAAGKADEAEVTLSAVAARDPLSALAVLKLQLARGQDKAAATAEASKLLSQLPTDVWPLVVREQLKDLGPVHFRTADTDAVAAAAAKLPRDALAFAQDPRSIYLLDVEALSGTVAVGEPVLVRVTLQNASNRPLALGPGGAVGQNVAVDATVRSATDQAFPAVALAKLGGRLVVGPRQAVDTVVRLDSAELSNAVGAVPQTGASVFVSAVANPSLKQGAIVPGPGGVRAQGRGVVDRPPLAFNRPETRDALTRQLASTDGLQRRRACAALGACAAYLANGTAEQKALAGDALKMLQQTATHDASSGVRATAWQELATGQPEPKRTEVIKQMLATPDAETRTLACLLTLNKSHADRLPLLRPLAGDADPMLATLAASVLALPDPPAPASQPAKP